MGIISSSNSPWLVLAGLWCLYSAFGLIAVSISPLVLPIESDLGFSHTAMGSIMGAWQLVYIFSAIPSGMLLDRLGAKKALLIGGCLIALSAFGRAFATDYWTLLVAVMIFGLGGPIISAGAPKVVASLFSGSRRGLAMGIYMTGPALGGVAALTLTNSILIPNFALTSSITSWRMVFVSWGCLALAATFAWLLFSRQGHPADRDITQDSSIRSQFRVVGDVIKLPGVKLLMLMSVGAFIYQHGLNNWLPALLTETGMTVVNAGYWAALPTVVGILGSLLIPRLATPQRRFLILTGLCMSAAVATVFLQSTQTVNLTTGLILQGIVRSSLMTVLVLTLVELPGIGDKRAGTATGLFFSAAEVGGVLGPLGLGLMYDYSGGFTWSLLLLTGIMLIMALSTNHLQKAVDPKIAQNSISKDENTD